jgi:hypothetical protein
MMNALSTTTERSPYRGIVSSHTQRRLAQMAASPGLILHEARWHLASSAYTSTWTERQLQLDGHYWLFLLGLNNSGTTMLADILTSHPLVRSLPDKSSKLTGALPRSTDEGVRRNWTARTDLFRLTEESDPAPARRARYDWSYFYDRRPGVLLQKSTPHTLRARWLQRHFEPNRFLATVRNPYAVCEGVRRREGISIEDAATHWARGNEFLLADMPHLERCLFFTYEAFCADPAEHIDRIERFLGLDGAFDRTVIARPIRAHNIEGDPQIIQNLNSKSIERLSQSDIETVGRIAGPVMEQFGYERI